MGNDDFILFRATLLLLRGTSDEIGEKLLRDLEVHRNWKADEQRYL